MKSLFFSLPVLMYHSISNYEHRLCVPPELFDDHCRSLAEAGWRGISLAEAEDYFLKKKRLPPKVCLFTFDDGYLDNHVYAEPILRRHGHQGAIFPVVGLIEDNAQPRPNLDQIQERPEAGEELPQLDKRYTTVRAGRPVAGINLCNWSELRGMHEKGSLSAAPHSMRHARVVRSLKIKRLYMPRGRSGFFAVPPYEMPWGFPCFDLGHALADRAYNIAPELFDLIRNMVPQTDKEARAYLEDADKREAVLQAVHSLPVLGVRESETEYRARIAAEFAACRDTFREKMGFSPISFCWPWGSYNNIALQEARKAGFRVFFTTGRRANLYGGAKAVHRITIRRESAEQVLRMVRFASHAILEECLGWLQEIP